MSNKSNFYVKQSYKSSFFGHRVKYSWNLGQAYLSVVYYSESYRKGTRFHNVIKVKRIIIHIIWRWNLLESSVSCFILGFWLLSKWMLVRFLDDVGQVWDIANKICIHCYSKIALFNNSVINFSNIYLIDNVNSNIFPDLPTTTTYSAKIWREMMRGLRHIDNAHFLISQWDLKLILIERK